MKAICVTPDRRLDVRSIPAPGAPPAGHLRIEIDAATITHGDKFFLTRPLPGATTLTAGGQAVYGANAAGRVTAIGPDVPAEYSGKKVAIYKALHRSAESIGVWCETAQLPYATCLILPDEVPPRDYCGSFGNILTVHAFLAEIRAGGHKGVIVTAGNSATGRIAVSLTRRLQVPAVFLVRSAAAREDLLRHGAAHVLVTSEEGFESRLGGLAATLEATAVFDGVGGDLLSRIVPSLPMNATVFIYGFLGAANPIALSTMLVMGKNLTLRRFSILESATVRDPKALASATADIRRFIGDPLLTTRIGREFRFDAIEAAMAFEALPGARAVLVP